MSNFDNLVTVKAVPEMINVIALDPPAWTRLEPQSVTGDPTPGLEARVHDPLWLLVRQWQFGEFQGEDAGTPLGVEVATSSQRVTAWQPGDPTGNAVARPLPANKPLDPFVEREALPSPGLRQRAEAGALLVTALAEVGFDARSVLLAACPLPLPATGSVAAQNIPRLFRTLALSCPDGESAAKALEVARAAGPPWLAGAPAGATTIAQDWLTWYRRSVSPRTADEMDSWIPERIEYRFSIRTGRDDTPRVFNAPLHDGGAIDWHTFDHAPLRRLTLSQETDEPVESSGRRTIMASPLRYAGMPADRLWQFEDGTVNLGQLEIQRYDLARLCFVEFAMIYGNDWFVVPVDVNTGTFVVTTELAYTTTFGDRFVVPPADDRNRTGRFRLFEMSIGGSDETLRGLLIPPSARSTLEGRPLEEVFFLRDESANMAWALEVSVQGASGEPRSRRDEAQPEIPSSPLKRDAELQYRLATTVPRYWIPLVPIRTDGRGGFVLRKATMTNEDESMGQLLEATPLTLHEEEVPREGVCVRRVAALTRAADGQYHRWISRRVIVGRGEGSSGLAFDGTFP
jgi:hypothetical protein